ncbi:SDR family oxidoreductase [Pseudonocardia spinosispora]|uniref:SDR family oxidoreductase n=1 Tax=Pseudonocardia spinosispora TaxID=103441 RepID=UPI00041C47C8|nr:SDR family oxidoreductase [Pseudonocardia spinosispora]
MIGAAGGIGAATVRRLIADGWVVAALDVDARVKELAGPGCVPVVGDAREEMALDNAFEALGGHPVAGLVHCVLAEHRGALLDQDREDLMWALDLGAVSAHSAIRALAGRAQGPSSAVLVSSVQAAGVVPGQAAYAMGKAALEALARVAAVELGRVGLRCNVVRPGFVPVPRNEHRWAEQSGRAELAEWFPLRRLCNPSEVADAIAFLVGDESTYLSGSVLTVDGAANLVLPEAVPTDRRWQ